MTDFKFRLNSKKRKKAAGKWQSIVAIVVTLALISVIFLGFLRGIRLKGGFKGSVWDGSSPVAIALDTDPASILVFQKESKKVAFLVIPKDIDYATGDALEPVMNVNDSIRDSGEDGRRFMEKYFGVKIGGYMNFDNQRTMNEEEAAKIFKDFAFIAAPMSIVFQGLTSGVAETNLNRSDLLRLWWQVKGISIDNIDYVDLEKYSVEIIGAGDKSFKGLDRDIVRKSIAIYFEDRRITGKHIEVEIINSSGESGMGTLVSDIAEIYGFDIVSVSSSDALSDETKITASGNKKDAYYLAKLFDCDIFWQQNISEESRITLNVGRDFANAYK